MSVVPGRTDSVYVIRRFNASSAGNYPRGWTYAETSKVNASHISHLKPEANNTGLSNYCHVASKVSTFDLRHSSFLLLLALFCPLALADAFTFPATIEASSLVNPAEVDLDCLTTDDANEELVLNTHTPSRLPGGPEQVPNVSADRAHVSPRYDQETPLATTTTPNPIALPQPGLVPAFLFSSYFPDSPNKYLRERGPPSAVASAKVDPSLA